MCEVVAVVCHYFVAISACIFLSLFSLEWHKEYLVVGMVMSALNVAIYYICAGADILYCRYRIQNNLFLLLFLQGQLFLAAMGRTRRKSGSSIDPGDSIPSAKAGIWYGDGWTSGLKQICLFCWPRRLSSLCNLECTHMVVGQWTDISISISLSALLSFSVSFLGSISSYSVSKVVRLD